MSAFAHIPLLQLMLAARRVERFKRASPLLQSAFLQPSPSERMVGSRTRIDGAHEYRAAGSAPATEDDSDDHS